MLFKNSFFKTKMLPEQEQYKWRRIRRHPLLYLDYYKNFYANRHNLIHFHILSLIDFGNIANDIYFNIFYPVFILLSFTFLKSFLLKCIFANVYYFIRFIKLMNFSEHRTVEGCWSKLLNPKILGRSFPQFI